MKIKTTFRNLAAIATLSAIGFTGGPGLLSSGASASTTGTAPTVPVLGRDNLRVSNVMTVDLNNGGQESMIWHPPVGAFAGYWTLNPYTPLNPDRIHAGDLISVCATVTATRFATTSPTALTITGPDYSWAGTVPAISKGSSATACSPFNSLNFTRAAELGLISTGSGGLRYPGNQCVPIVLTAKAGFSSSDSRGFWQDGLPANCGVGHIG